MILLDARRELEAGNHSRVRYAWSWCFTDGPDRYDSDVVNLPLKWGVITSANDDVGWVVSHQGQHLLVTLIDRKVFGGIHGRAMDDN